MCRICRGIAVLGARRDFEGGCQKLGGIWPTKSRLKATFWLSAEVAPECSAAVAAARNGARVLLLDKNVIGRGGATIMAQMTCASALGEVEPDSPQLHLEDTLGAIRGSVQRESRRASVRR